MTKDSSENRVLIIVGPTAVGKTRLSITLALALDGQIVSADSRQVYRYMDIGTAKPDRSELAAVPHHFIDIRDPDDYYSAGAYGREARECIAKLQQEHITPVVAGGSGFYIQALVDGLFAPALSDLAVKEKWRRRLAEEGTDAVFGILSQVDPETACRLHPNDNQRIVRALEVYELAGIPISEFRRGRQTAAPFTPVFIGLNRPREQLYRRIDQRVDEMIEAGLIDEVDYLLKRGWGSELNALRTVGYREVFQFFDGEYTRDEMVERIKTNSRRYAKRQLTWFGKDDRIRWIDMEGRELCQVVEEIVMIYRGSSYQSK